MATNMKLVMSIINFLKEESAKQSLTADTRESLEVSVQCLLTAYDIDSNDARLKQKELLRLEEIFDSAILSSEEIDDKNLPGELNKAAMMKNIGNNLMKSNQFSEAIRYYTAAIELDSQNAIYYGNRAAAYSRLNDFKNAIKDCEKAIEIDSKYAKAYGRMGLAYTSLEEYDKAVEAFNKALELEPDSPTYQSNLRIALEKRDKTPPNPTEEAGLNMDWGNIFSNPAFRNMASTLMSDPSIINAISAGMNTFNRPPPVATDGSGDNQASASTPRPPPASNNRSFDMLLEAGQILAAQMQAANPELVEQFRQSATRNPNPPNQDNRDPQ